MSKAAEELHITQPTLSRQIKSLEESLGTTLFNRENKKMTLTNTGIIFQERAQQIIQLVNKAEQDISTEKELNGTIAIGCVESIVTNFLGSMVASFHDKYPKVKFTIYDADGNDIREKIDNNTLDIGFLLSPVEVAKYNRIKLPITDYWGLVVPKNDDLATNKKITTSELRKLPLIIPSRDIVQDEFVSWTNVSSSELNIVSSQNLLSNSLFLVKAGIGYALCAAGSFTLRPDKDLTLIPIDNGLVIKHTLAWKKNHHLSTAAQAFIAFIKSQINNPNSLWQLYNAQNN